MNRTPSSQQLQFLLDCCVSRTSTDLPFLTVYFEIPDGRSPFPAMRAPFLDRIKPLIVQTSEYAKMLLEDSKSFVSTLPPKYMEHLFWVCFFVASTTLVLLLLHTLSFFALEIPSDSANTLATKKKLRVLFCAHFLRPSFAHQVETKLKLGPGMLTRIRAKLGMVDDDDDDDDDAGQAAAAAAAASSVQLCCNPVCSGHLNLKQCSRCRTVRYCSSECQKKDWPRHKTACIPKETPK
jgi:hypothetical protein